MNHVMTEVCKYNKKIYYKITTDAKELNVTEPSVVDSSLYVTDLNSVSWIYCCLAWN